MGNKVTSEATINSRWEYSYDPECGVAYDNYFEGEKKIGCITSAEGFMGWQYQITINYQFVATVYGKEISEARKEFMKLIEFVTTNPIY